ncbi:MAG: hypothetical protein AUI14_10295 [Actinobacteria bacterium 13_2_20CM_2_71_6]|nr:MAG: hypothetical protein AUI14_10295 [Actinobacteria bacterium 13_2_20CM_2_71_6]
MTDFADLPLDGDDQLVLDRLAAIHTLLDPPPADLDERVRFAIAIAVADIDVEVARLSQDMLVGTGARGSERTRTITFDADRRTIMITIVDRTDGLVRLDGWLAPAAALRVELRFPAPAPAQMVTSDDTGRFVFDGVPHGLAQLLVHPPDLGDSTRVVTPSLAL